MLNCPMVAEVASSDSNPGNSMLVSKSGISVILITEKKSGPAITGNFYPMERRRETITFAFLSVCALFTEEKNTNSRSLQVLHNSRSSDRY